MMKGRREPRVYYKGVVAHKKVMYTEPLCTSHRTLLCGVCVFLSAAVGALYFFLSQSDIVTKSGLRLSGSGGTKIIQCQTDKDCENCCTDFQLSHLGACLLPPTNTTASCVKGCCVPPQPIPQVQGFPCDDHKWCTVQDVCDGAGQCVGTERNCVDENFCTLEACSEKLRSCVGGVAVDDASICENECETNENCRTDFFCAKNRCAQFSAKNTTLFFLGYEIVNCNDSPDGFAMVQRYSVTELGYSLNVPEADGGGMRYRVLQHSNNIVLPASKASDAVTLNLAKAFGVQSRIFPSKNGSSAYSEITFSLQTECLQLTDVGSCLTAWMDRKYEFELDVEDCSVSADDPLGPFDGNTIGVCMPVKIRRPFAMSLNVVYCPKFPQYTLAPRRPGLRVEYANAPGVPIERSQPGRRLRVVVEPTEEERQRSLGDYDIFLTDVTYCGVRDDHRLAHCVYNEEGNCPFRGCRGWGDHDPPVTFVNNYMEKTDMLAAAVVDLIDFCRGNGTLYEPSGCVPGFCDWSSHDSPTNLGNADGFAFYLEAPQNTNIVIDVRYRFELCSDEASGRRLVPAAIKQRISVLQVVVDA